MINDTQVQSRRVPCDDREFLFLHPLGSPHRWAVLFPARAHRLGESFSLPGGVTAYLRSKGLPQEIEVDQNLDENYFERFGEPPLPPYIQRVRNERRARKEDLKWYQSAWAKVPGSLAAPTASLHFSQKDLEFLIQHGIEISPLTLHVGLGTFLPIKTDDLSQHKMHSEWVKIPQSTWAQVTQRLKNRQSSRIWAMGTTVLRALEACHLGNLSQNCDGDFEGETSLFIQPGFEFGVANGLLTNFHQPQSTLLALVSAFAGHQTVMNAYRWAIEQRFKLFSYGDLSVWTR